MALRSFISFSRKDNRFIRRLLSRLDSQPLSPWIFESEEEEIKGGKRISEILDEEILRADVFIPVLSENSFRSDYTKEEVRFALQLVDSGTCLTIWPLVSTDLHNVPVNTWPHPYDQLCDIRYRFVDFDSRASLETNIIQLCRDLEISYTPCVPDSFRLPFMSRFVEEIEYRCPRRDEYESGVYRRLMITLSEFSELFEAKKFNEAEQTLAYLIATCEYEFPDQQFYFPYIVLGTCLLVSERDYEAQAVFRKLLDHPCKDESVLGGLAKACERVGDYGQAVELYNLALDLDANDLAAQLGVVVNSWLSGSPSPTDPDMLLQKIEKERNSLLQCQTDPDIIGAIVESQFGRSEKAVERLKSKIYGGVTDDMQANEIAYILDRCGETTHAAEFLEQYPGTKSNADLVRQLAEYLAVSVTDNRGLKKVKTLCDRLLELRPRDRQCVAQAAQILWLCGDTRRVHQICTNYLDENSRSDLPGCKEDFYWDGLINWLANRFERAEYDFLRSGKPSGYHYRKILDS